MRRKLFTFTAVLSLLLCAATLFLWSDSADAMDGGSDLRIAWREFRETAGVKRYMVQSIDGCMWLLSYDPRLEAKENPGCGPRGTYLLLGIPGKIAHRDYTPTDGKADFGVLGFNFNWTCASGLAPPGAHGIVVIPYWPFALLFSILPALAVRRLYQTKVRAKLSLLGYCANCRYNLTGNTSGVCPECGTTVAKPFR